MARYLTKYKGTYRVKAHIDQSTNDYPREPEHNNIDQSFDDIYIKCANGAQIYHYGRSVLVAYIPSVGRGHNILKALGKRLLDFSHPDDTPYDYKKLYDALKVEGTILDIVETDAEIEFKFKDSNISLIAEYLKPQTSGANISPFSTRNLPKSTYVIPAEDLAAYKEITNKVPTEDKLSISKVTKDFMAQILSRDRLYKTVEMRADMRKKILKGKEYIHQMRYWDKYLKYLENNLGGNNG